MDGLNIIPGEISSANDPLNELPRQHFGEISSLFTTSRPKNI
jgi:hypothetical protein